MMDLKAVERTDFVAHLASDVRPESLKQGRGMGRRDHVEVAASCEELAKEAASQPSYQPPAERVSVVKAAFVLAGLAARPQKTAGPILLLYDNFSQPATAGIRSGATRVRQLLYRAEPYQVDLQIEALPESNRLLVSGQLLDVSHPEMVGREVQVTLSNCRGSLVSTVTNQFGEFHAELDNSGDLQLSLVGHAGKPIVILLRGALDPSSAIEE
jgi:hypothetical protein